jgi:hypothetical protein
MVSLSDEARRRAVLLDHEGREQRARGVVHGHDQVEFRPLWQRGMPLN